MIMSFRGYGVRSFEKKATYVEVNEQALQQFHFIVEVSLPFGRRKSGELSENKIIDMKRTEPEIIAFEVLSSFSTTFYL